jgi:hypothetical protein
VATLQKIHEAGVTHEDIAAPNLCINNDGEAFIIDFTHARHRSDEGIQLLEEFQLLKAAEMATLHKLLKLDLSATRATPKTTLVAVTTLKRSDRIRKQKQEAEANKPAANKGIANKPAVNKGTANKPAANKGTANKPAANKGAVNKADGADQGASVKKTKAPPKKATLKQIKAPPKRNRRAPVQRTAAKDAANEAAKKAAKERTVAKIAKATRAKTVRNPTSANRSSRPQEKEIRPEDGPYRGTRSRSQR